MKIDTTIFLLITEYCKLDMTSVLF